MTAQQALSCAAWLTGAWALAFALLLTASHSSGRGSYLVVVNRSVFGHQSILLVLKDTWGYCG